MSWKTRLRYGRTVKNCHEIIATWARCSNQGQNKERCTNTEVGYCRYGSDHQAFSMNCPIFKRETEIVQFQTEERIPRQQVIRKLLRINLHPELIFSNAVKNTSNRTTSKSPTRTNQESQSESIEDDSLPVPFYGRLQLAVGRAGSSV